MKKLFSLLLMSVFSIPFIQGQTIDDALLYSLQEIRGTARFRSLSGAFGSLGGDLSAIQVNPAGSAVFTNSTTSFTISHDWQENTSLFGNSSVSTENRGYNFDQLGAVFVYRNTNEEAAITKFSLGLAYNQTQDNRNFFVASGLTPNSIDTYFLEAAQGIPVGDLQTRTGQSIGDAYDGIGNGSGGVSGSQAQDAFLGFQSEIIDLRDSGEEEPNPTEYVSTLAGNTFDQEYVFESTGINGKFTANLGVQIQDDLYLGGNINSHFINYDRITVLDELNTNTGSRINNITFENRLSTLGAGVSFQVGAIAKLSSSLRASIAYESPTWYTIQEETTQSLSTRFTEDNGVLRLRPNVINTFPEYQLRTPARITAGGAIIFGKQGLISFDYSRQDFTEMEFDGEFPELFADRNQAIKDVFTTSQTYRLGGEMRSGNVSFRGGVHYTESPYVDTTVYDDTSGYSLGIGFNGSSFGVDFAYTNTIQATRDEVFYPGSGFNNGTTIIDDTRSSVSMTLNFKF